MKKIIQFIIQIMKKIFIRIPSSHYYVTYMSVFYLMMGIITLFFNYSFDDNMFNKPDNFTNIYIIDNPIINESLSTLDISNRWNFTTQNYFSGKTIRFVLKPIVSSNNKQLIWYIASYFFFCLGFWDIIEDKQFVELMKKYNITV